MTSADSELTVIVSRPLGRYRLVSRLGEGGMGVVHLAVDPAGTPVAVKVLRPHVAGDEMGRARLAREVDTLRRVRGPRVAEVLDADVTAPEPYIVTRYVPGPSLEKVVRERGPLSLRALHLLADGLAEALCTLGAAGVVHRDLKPGNVLLDDGGPVLIDFGIARVADDSTLTAAGLLVGTPGYLSPEVVAGDRATAASDVYSLAATLAFAATGRPPFGQGPFDVVLANISRGVIDLDGIDDGYADLLRPMLAADPGARPTAAAVRERARSGLARWAGAANNGHRPAGTSEVTQVVAMPGGHRRSGLAGTGDVTQVVAAPRGLPDTKELTAATARVPAPAGAAPATAPATVPARVPPDAPAAGSTPESAPAAARGPAPPSTSQSRDAWPPEPRPHGEPPASRAGLSVAGYAALVALAAVLPLVALFVLVAVLVLLRSVTTSWRALTLRRTSRGRHWSDGPATALMLPWRICTAALVTALTVTLASFAAAGAFVFGWLATGSPDGAGPPAAAAAVSVLQLWWGPGGSAVRHGWRLSTSRLLPTQRATIVATLLLTALAVLAAAGALAVPEADWWPATGTPSEAMRAAGQASLGNLSGLVIPQSLVSP